MKEFSLLVLASIRKLRTTIYSFVVLSLKIKSSQQKDLISSVNNFKMTLSEIQTGLNLASNQAMDIQY